MKVLLLEDDCLQTEAYREALEAEGHGVVVTHDNDTAIASLREHRFDLLIFDLLIGRETSIPVLDYATYAQPGAEIILVTGSGLFPRGELHYSVSDVSYRFQKPINLDDLVSVVAHFERTVLPRQDVPS